MPKCSADDCEIPVRSSKGGLCKKHYDRAWRSKNSQGISDRMKRYNRERATSDPRVRLLDGARSRATRKGLPFGITIEDVHLPERCPLLDIPLVLGSGRATNSSPSLDRIDPKLGYVPGNVRVISYQANSVKRDLSPDQLVKFCVNVLASTSQAAIHPLKESNR